MIVSLILLALSSSLLLLTTESSVSDYQSQLHLGSGQLSQEEFYTKTGTTIVGICCKNGIVLGADTRSTGGPLVMDKNKRKVHPISERIFCCAAGTSADCDQVTRRAAHDLALARIDREMSGDTSANSDGVASAVVSIVNSLSRPTNAKRKPSSVLILGGVDKSGPSLFQIDGDGAPQKVCFASLGSGSLNALSVIEAAKSKWRMQVSQKGDSSALNEDWGAHLDVTNAVDIVRNAVRAGIMNDLGSGSHVDLCVICHDSIDQWREEMVSTWESERVSSFLINDQSMNPNSDGSDNSSNSSSSRSDDGGSIASEEGRMHSMSSEEKSESISLGDIVHRKHSPVKYMYRGQLKEHSSFISKDLSCNVEIL